MHHQLALHSVDPRDELVARIRRDAPPSAWGTLERLATFHGGGVAEAGHLRSTFACNTAGRFFPHPIDVPGLMDALLERLSATFHACSSPADDLAVAVFAIYGILAVHPFANGNGRTAVDFAQLLLMHRWNLKRPPLALPPQAHLTLGRVLAGWDPPNSGQSPEEFLRLRYVLEHRFTHTNLADMHTSPALRAAARWLCHADTSGLLLRQEDRS